MYSNMSSRSRLSSIFRQVRSYSAPADRSIPAAKQKYVPTSGTYPKGFLAGTSHAGVKASNTQYDDIALVVSEKPCSAAAVVTRNLFKAAPVQVTWKLIASRGNRGLRGVVVNSGCANAVTGSQGLADAESMAKVTDACYEEDAEGAKDTASNSTDQPMEQEGSRDLSRTLVMSTGVIGQKLPIEKITSAIPKAHAALGSDHENWLRAASAICTTDTFPKLMSRTFTLPSDPERQYSIAGMTKGAGMIHPNMGTLLAIICTDAKIEPAAIRWVLRYANRPSFNCISIDGDTSTNDTVALLANGAAAPENAEAVGFNDGSRARDPFDNWSPDLQRFADVVKDFMTDLAKLVVRDGEGATKFVTVRVQTCAMAKGYATAKSVAASIATSSLVKTALYGKDANWGRILCAIGYARKPTLGNFRKEQTRPESRADDAKPPNILLSRTSVSFVPADGSPELKLLVRGEPEDVDEERAKQILEMEDLEILVRLNDSEEVDQQEGFEEAVVWTCDFSHEYVTINGDYRT